MYSSALLRATLRFAASKNVTQSVQGASMLVRNLERQECLEFLKQIGFGRLGCVNKNQPYVVPIYFAYESEQLFGFSTEGQKIRWMRDNPLVCVLADAAGIPATTFITNDIDSEYRRLQGLAVSFRGGPQSMAQSPP